MKLSCIISIFTMVRYISWANSFRSIILLHMKLHEYIAYYVDPSNMGICSNFHCCLHRKPGILANCWFPDQTIHYRDAEN